MIIEIKGLGAVKSAQIDLTKKLTVFCGYNNTGKTYVSYIIYALTCRQKFVPKLLSEEITSSLIDKGEYIYSINFEELIAYRNEFIEYIKNNLNELFGISKEQSNKFFGTFSLKFTSTEEEFKSKIIAEEFRDHFNWDSFDVEAIKEAGACNIMLKMTFKSLTARDIENMRLLLLPNLYLSLSLYPITKSFIFPVERNSIYTFSRELSIKRNYLIDQMQGISTSNIESLDYLLKRTTRYPQPIRDGLEIAEDMFNIQKHDSEFKKFAERLEDELLLGKVSVSNEGEVLFTSSKAKSKKLPIHLSASIVKTLSSLVFYLKHLAKRNDLIIIDEPEVNLHPESQVVLARIFAQLINAGFRLLISTHSDYILRELNNLIMLSTNSPDVNSIREEYGYLENEKISQSDVNAYYFEYKSKTAVVVKSLKVTECGFGVPSIDNTLQVLNSTSEDLYYAIKYPEQDEGSE